MSGRNFRRLCVRYEEDGIEGLRDRRLGKVSPRRAPAGELARMQGLYRACYGDFTVKHFHEQLVKRHGYKLCYTVTKASLQAAGLVAKAKRRERRPLPGMLLFQDGSTHRWLAALGRDLDLVVVHHRRARKRSGVAAGGEGAAARPRAAHRRAGGRRRGQ
jgi:hypothetical protein